MARALQGGIIALTESGVSQQVSGGQQIQN